jgi:integrase
MTTRHQTGYVWRVGRSWFGRWYENQVIDGVTVRRQHAEKLCEYCDRYRSKKDVRPLLDEKLAPINDGSHSAQSTLSVVKYFEDVFLPHVEAELKPSTVHGYRGLFRMYLKPYLGDIALRDFKCGHACRLLAELHAKHKLSTKSLRHCKALLQTVFTYAKRMDVLDKENPVKNATWPQGKNGAKPAGQDHAYTIQEVTTMLHTLEGTARVAVALMYFCGLRPGEARAARWTDYDVAKSILNIKRSIWRKEETGPKTEKSIAPVHVSPALREILAVLPHSSEYILVTPSGRPIDFHNLAARVIVPGLNRCAVCRKPEHKKTDHEFTRDVELPEWKGFYALRRGLGTTLADVDTAMAAMSALRHANMATTTAHYVKTVDAAAVRGLDKVSSLFDNTNASGRPN